MSTVTRERLAEIKARYTAASDAPWSYDPEDGWIESDGKCGGGIAMMHPHGNINTVIKHNETFSKDDAEFITHARTDVPDLVETLEGACRLLDTLYSRFACSKCVSWKPGVKPPCTCGFAEVSNFLEEVGAP